MIRLDTGEFKLEEPHLVIHPELTLGEFRACHTFASSGNPAESQGWISYEFNGYIDGMGASFHICFKFGRLHLLQWNPDEAWKRQHLIAEDTIGDGLKADTILKRELDDWLYVTTNCRAPYEYEWGYITTMLDPNRSVPSITVIFRNDLLDRGITDLKSFYLERRKYWEGE